MNEVDEITEKEETIDQVEHKLFSQILREFAIYTIIILLVGFAISTIDLYASIIVISGLSALVSLRLLGLTIAWGMVYSNKFVDW